MKFNLKIFISIIILFFSFEILEIKAHNTINGGCRDHCSTFINRKSNESKIKKLIRDHNSCVNNSLCRG